MYAKSLETGNQINWFTILIMIRRLFLCFDTLFKRLESDTLSFADTLEEVLSLQSLKDLISQVPFSCERIRNLFEFLLLDSLNQLQGIVEKAKVSQEKRETLDALSGVFKNYADHKFKFAQQLTDYQPS